jgi:hypothetical protein
MAVSLENPILNSRSRKLSQHWGRDEKGLGTGNRREGRHASVYIIAIAQARGGHPDQTTLGATGEAAAGANDLVNSVRQGLDATAALPPGQRAVTNETRRLLAHCVTHARPAAVLLPLSTRPRP